MTDLSTLADRVEEGTVEMQGSLLGTAFGVLFPRVLASHPDYARRLKDRIAFSTKLDAGAYVDAAMMLVPEGWRLNLEQHNTCWTAELASAPWFDDTRKIGEAEGISAALALAAAALRAHASEATNV